MPTVWFSGPNNSTFFTTCCSVAICEYERDCPVCGLAVEPYEHRSRWEVAMTAMYGVERLRKMRQSYSKYD